MSLLKNLLGDSNPVGQAAQLGLSGGQMIAGLVNRKKADAAVPMSENPMERQMLNTIRRRRQALQTGTAGTADRTAMRQMAKGYQTGAMRSGGPVNFGQYNQLLSNAAGNLAAANGQQLNQLLGMEQKQTGDMANLANDIALLRSNRLSAQAENQMKAGTQNMLASIGSDITEPTAKRKKGMGIGVLKLDPNTATTTTATTTASIPAFATPGASLNSIMGLGK